jgi:hypothetical protein
MGSINYNLIDIVSAALDKVAILCWGPSQGSILLELECSCSPCKDLWWINCYTLIMNKIHSTVHAVVRGTQIHTYITYLHTYRKGREPVFHKPLFPIQGRLTSKLFKNLELDIFTMTILPWPASYKYERVKSTKHRHILDGKLLPVCSSHKSAAYFTILKWLRTVRLLRTMKWGVM